MSVALPTSVLRAAREDTTEAPSMPTKHHIMMIMQLKIWVPTPPRGAASGPYCPAATALSYTLPQKSAVKSEVLRLILQGKDNQNIASTLTIAPSTVKVYVHRLLQKTECENRQGLIQDFWRSA